MVTECEALLAFLLTLIAKTLAVEMRDDNATVARSRRAHCYMTGTLGRPCMCVEKTQMQCHLLLERGLMDSPPERPPSDGVTGYPVLLYGALDAVGTGNEKSFTGR